MPGLMELEKSKRSLALKRLNDVYNCAKRSLTDPSLSSRFKIHLDRLSSILDNFDRSHTDIVASLTDEQSLIEAEEIRQNFDETYADIMEIKYRLFSDNSNPDESKSNVSRNCTSSRGNIRMPRITIPTFEGGYKNWITFYDLYRVLVHENSDLSNIEKFQYLVSALKGEPLNLIKAFPISDINYNVAYETLVKRYQNKRQLAFFAWQAIDSVKLQNNSPRAFRFLLDTFQENLAILKSLELPVDQWNFITFYTLFYKLDSNIRKEFEMTVSSQDIPSYESLETFVDNYCKALEHAGPSSVRTFTPRNESNSSRAQRNNKPITLTTSQSHSSNLSPPPPCVYCSNQHFIYHCPEFRKLTIEQRSQTVRDKQLCFNCLRPNHIVSNCPSKSSCGSCGKRHNSLLHSKPSVSDNQALSSPVANSSNAVSVQVLSSSNADNKTVLLSTAQAEILDKWQNFHTVRALLDSGSQANYITQTLARRLGLHITYNSPSVFGLGNISTPVLGTVQCTIRPENCSGKELSFEAIVIKRICDNMPSVNLDTSFLNNLGFIKPADPTFHSPGPIDLLLGAGLWNDILLPGIITGTDNSPIGLNTIFGWVFLGPSRCKNNLPSLSSNLCSVHTFVTCKSNLDDDLKRLWEIEDLPDRQFTISPEDSCCEESFVSTHQRHPSGKFVVELPFKHPEPTFRNMRMIAVERFYKLETRLLKNPSLRESYNAFMRDYIESGHMTEIPSSDERSSQCYYIPHHCVTSQSSTTTKLRVVFDASARDGVGLSLNDTQLTGPKLQADIFGILVRFRLHSVVFTTDIRQMYRNILVAEKHKDFQRIVWRFCPDEPLKEYRLNTVTYGVSSSPFLALRTIKELADTDGKSFPKAAQVLDKDIYVDDIPTGTPSIEEALELQSELISLMSQGGFELRKWASNRPELLNHLPKEHCLAQPSSFDADSEAVVKILGINWDSVSDSFSYKVNSTNEQCTKRTILSKLSRVFDPLGLLSPVTFLAKYLVQRLWLLGLDWDQEPPEDILSLWAQFCAQLPNLSGLSIPRQITHPNAIAYQLHGFCDASLSGYAAAIYLRAELSDGSVCCNLICAKSRVAPTKRITLPRLELCAAVLLANLFEFILSHTSNLISIDNVYAWSDSTIVLSWISSHPSRWKIFVGNRVAKIQHKLPCASWKYVGTDNNPADVATRGVLPNPLLSHELWWTGPNFLLLSSSEWPSSHNFSPSSEITTELHNEEKKSALVGTVETDTIQQLLLRFSSLKKILRTLAVARRFLQRLRKQTTYTGAICEKELSEVLLDLVKYCQRSAFSSEIHCIESNKPLPKPFRKLSPFLASDGVLRVGGRLQHSELPYEAKHPAILPSNHRLSELIIDDLHQRSLHAGPQMVQFLLTQNFWILSARRAIKKRLSNCIPCFRAKPVPSQPLMGDLPSVRVTAIKAFQRVGSDYAGPFQVIHGRRRRGVRPDAVYLCLFVCLSTKAIHLEIANDLSSNSFIAALRRFISRRGRCSLLLSDCGTNFIGAHRSLSLLMQSAAESESIEFKTIPPSSPHFGGVWEAGVRSVKSHLTRVVGNHLLTYEEFHTLIVQIEAVLNSRPLCAVSDDPNDFSVLTPGHFLTLSPLCTVPDSHDCQEKLTISQRWQLLQRLHADFWSRWHRDYLNSLQQRTKWTENCRPIKVGDLVIVKDDNTKPIRWPTARVVKVHPGADNIVRVATIRMVASEKDIGSKVKEFKRPVVKLCLLPVHDS